MFQRNIYLESGSTHETTRPREVDVDPRLRHGIAKIEVMHQGEVIEVVATPPRKAE